MSGPSQSLLLWNADNKTTLEDDGKGQGQSRHSIMALFIISDDVESDLSARSKVHFL